MEKSARKWHLKKGVATNCKAQYFGESGLDTQIKEQENQIDPKLARTIELDNLNANSEMTYRICIGKFGAYIEAGNGEDIVKASIPEDLTPSDLDPEQIEKLLKQKTDGPEELGIHPEEDKPIYIMTGRYGPYVQLGDESEAVRRNQSEPLYRRVSIWRM